jgi:asparagine synthase (glutamine-hydrolysing)
MCGIYGLIARRGDVDPAFVIRQRDLLMHRGPDDAGLWMGAGGRIGFGHRRLAILDLSPAGHQPMASADGRLVITFNGEIYNYLQVREELALAGYSFFTGSDTEVLLAAWDHWGEASLSRLNGMFAFALYDAGSTHAPASVYFARDRVGKKPLYYSLGDGRLEFASELKAISSRGGLSMTALNYYLAVGYVPHDLCISAGVRKLPPAHLARLSLDTFDFKVTRYWAPPANQPADGIDGETLADQAGHLIRDATRLRLMADVPVGVLLSGGLDSSLVVAAAAEVSSSPVQTFTVTLPGSRLDESSYARVVADHFGTQHHELPLTESGVGTLDAFARFVDEPLADSSLLPAFMVSRLTREHVKVALGGDGGDELFGGYDTYPGTLADARKLARVPPILLRMMGNLAGSLPAGVAGRNRIFSVSHGPMQQLIWGSAHFDPLLRKRILSKEAMMALKPALDAPEQYLLALFATGTDPVDCMTRTHFGAVLPDDFLVKVDRASMAVSLEMRAPLLDYRLMEFAFGRIPSKWKVCGTETRRIQKILASRWLPPELDVGRKQGFSIPIDQWLRKAPRSWHEEWLGRLPEEINRQEARALLAGLLNGRANGTRIFNLAMLGLSTANLA